MDPVPLPIACFIHQRPVCSLNPARQVRVICRVVYHGMRHACQQRPAEIEFHVTAVGEPIAATRCNRSIIASRRTSTCLPGVFIIASWFIFAEERVDTTQSQHTNMVRFCLEFGYPAQKIRRWETARSICSPPQEPPYTKSSCKCAS